MPERMPPPPLPKPRGAQAVHPDDSPRHYNIYVRREEREVWRWANDAAIANGTSLSAVVAAALGYYMDAVEAAQNA